MRSFAPLLAVLALGAAGCTNYTAQRAAFLNSMVGQPETVLVGRLGVPTQTYETSGHKFLAYTTGRTTVYGGGGFGVGGFGYGGFGGFGSFDALPTEVIPRVCETTFDLVGGTVQSWSLHGNGC